MTRAQILRKLQAGIHPGSLKGARRIRKDKSGCERIVYFVGDWVIKTRLEREVVPEIHQEAVKDLKWAGIPYVRTYAANGWIVQPRLAPVEWKDLESRRRFAQLFELGRDIGPHNCGKDKNGKVWTHDY